MGAFLSINTGRGKFCIHTKSISKRLLTAVHMLAGLANSTNKQLEATQLHGDVFIS